MSNVALTRRTSHSASPAGMFANSRMIKPKGAIPLLARGGKCRTHARKKSAGANLCEEEECLSYEFSLTLVLVEVYSPQGITIGSYLDSPILIFGSYPRDSGV